MTTRFFLGSNSGRGFYSLYGGFARADGDFTYLIKAGPGGGKSSFMRRLGMDAEKRGLDVEYILCSGDPDSLDGIYIPEMRIAVTDATAPHPTEPDCFGAQCCYVNLGEFCRLPRGDENVLRLTKMYKSRYAHAYRMLSAAASLDEDISSVFSQPDILSAVKARACGLISRELGRKNVSDTGCVTERFVSCISCRGRLCLEDSIYGLCKHIYLLDDRFGTGDAYLEQIEQEALRHGENIIRCPKPLRPDVREAILIPERGLGFVCSSLCKPKEPWRHIRLDALIPAAQLKPERSRIRRCEKLRTALIGEAVSELEQAKLLHDELEAMYRPHIDFEALGRFTDDFAKKLF